MTAGVSLVLDSHAFIRYVQASPRLSDKARQTMDDATTADVPLMISAVTVVELTYLVEKGTFSQANVEASWAQTVVATGHDHCLSAWDDKDCR